MEIRMGGMSSYKTVESVCSLVEYTVRSVRLIN